MSKSLIAICLLNLISAAVVHGQTFNPERYKTERDRQQSEELRRESARNRYNEERRARESEERRSATQNEGRDGTRERIRINRSAEPEEKVAATTPAKASATEYGLGHHPAFLPLPPRPVIPVMQKPAVAPAAAPVSGYAGFRYPNGDSFAGRWVKHCPDSGWYYFANGDYYFGLFKGNSFSNLGYGSYTFANGDNLCSQSLRGDNGARQRTFTYSQHAAAVIWFINTATKKIETISVDFPGGGKYFGAYGEHGIPDGEFTYVFSGVKTHYLVTYKNGVEVAFRRHPYDY